MSNHLVVLDEVQQGRDGFVVQVEDSGLNGVTQQLTALRPDDDRLERLDVILSNVL